VTQPASTARANDPGRWQRRLSPDLLWDRRLAIAILVVVGIAMLGLLLFVSRWVTFWQDEWNFIVQRPDPSVRSFFAPQVDTLLATLVAVYEVLLAAFGLHTYLPYLLVTWLADFVCVGLLYHIVARRSGVLLGLMAGLSVLLLGSAFEDLLQPFQMQYLLAAAGGLLALDRLLLAEGEISGSHSRRDLTVAVLALVFAVASSSLGPIFVGLIVVWAVLHRDRAALLATVPAIALYGVWYAIWSGEFQALPGTGFSLVRGTESLLYGLGAATCGVVGLPPDHYAWIGTLILAAAGACVAVAVIRGLRPAPLAAAAFAALVAEYGLQAFFRGSFGVEHAARSGYLYPAALFVWLTISGIVGRGLDRGTWIGRGRLVLVPAAIFLLIVPMSIGNMRQFVGAARGEKGIRATEMAELDLAVAVRSVPGVDLDIGIDPDYIPQLTGRDYLAVIQRFGAPALAWDWESAADSQAVNMTAVRLLGPAVRFVPPPPSDAAAPPLDVKDGTAESGTSASCSVVRPSGPSTVVSVPVDRRAIWLKSPPPGMVLLVGIAGQPSALLDGRAGDALANGQAMILPNLPEPYRWQALLAQVGTQPFEVCSAPTQ